MGDIKIFQWWIFNRGIIFSFYPLMIDEITDRTLEQYSITYVVYLSNDEIRILVTRHKIIFYLVDNNNIFPLEKSKHLNYKQLSMDFLIKDWSKSEMLALEKKLFLEGLKFKGPKLRKNFKIKEWWCCRKLQRPFNKICLTRSKVDTS